MDVINRNITGLNNSPYIDNKSLNQSKDRSDTKTTLLLKALAEQTIQNSIPEKIEKNSSSLFGRIKIAIKQRYHQSTPLFQAKHSENHPVNDLALIQKEPIDPLLSILQEYKAFSVEGERHQSFMTNIREYVTDPAVTKYGSSWQDQTIKFQAPHQFLVDIIRASIMYQEVYPEDESEKGVADICAHIMERMGKGDASEGRLAFDNAAALLNQSSFADPIVLLDQKLKQKSYENGEFDTSEILAAGNLNDEDTEKRTMIYKLNIDTKDNVYLSLKMIGKIFTPGTKYGFFTHKREIIIPLNELSVDLKEIPVQQRFPSLQLTDIFSDLIYNLDEAVDQLNNED